MPDETEATMTLDARLVIGGLWKGAVVTMEGAAHGIVGGVVAVHRSADATRPAWVFGHESWHGYESVADGDSRYWTVSLELPGPLGCGAHGLEQRIQERLAGVEVVPEWCRTLRAEVSKRLVMFDGLADALTWPAGPGAPVYGWARGGKPGRWLLSGGQYASRPGTKSPTEYIVDESITDPMAALEAVWLREFDQRGHW